MPNNRNQNRKGQGRGQGQGMGQGMGGGNRPGAGPGGECVCPGCGTKIPHKQGVPCYNEVCSKCGSKMVRG